MPKYLFYFAGFLIVVVAAFSYRTYRTPEPVANEAFFGGLSLTLEYVTSTEQHQRGLSGRTDIPEKYGMLFVFERPGNYGFWMKDMLVPIDIFWLDKDFRVITLNNSVSTSTYPTVFYPTSPASYVLETKAGFGIEHGIATGTPLVLPSDRDISK